jgi:pimeloyl-ACP methyl ester carboxylesterase
MPKIRVNGAELYYEESGSGSETIIFSHGVLWSGKMFEAQMNALKSRYRVIAYDHRGQGQSEITESGYDMDTLYEDAAALIQALNAAPCHFAGLSMGGFIAMRLAARRPELLKSVILMATTSDPEPPANLPRYRLLNIVGRFIGFGLVVNPVMNIMFGHKFLNDSTRAAERELWKRRLMSNDRIGASRAVMGVVTRQGVYDEISKVKLPTLILIGDQDVATVPEKSQRIHAQILGSKLVMIPGAGHSASAEEPEAVNKAIIEFLDGLKP